MIDVNSRAGVIEQLARDNAWHVLSGALDRAIEQMIGEHSHTVRDLRTALDVMSGRARDLSAALELIRKRCPERDGWWANSVAAAALAGEPLPEE